MIIINLEKIILLNLFLKILLKKNILIVGNSYGEDFLKLFELNQNLFNKEVISLISPLKRSKNLSYEVSCLKELIVENSTICKNVNLQKIF